MARGREHVELDLPARPEYLAVVRTLVTSMAEAATAFSAGRVDDVRLAVTEACANAMDACTRAGEGGPDRIHVRIDFGRSLIVVEVHDGAGGFDPDALQPHPPVTEQRRLDFERGLGIPLMRALADRVEFRPEDGGTTVRLELSATRAR